MIEMLVLFSDGDEIGEEDLPRVLRGRSAPAGRAARRRLPFSEGGRGVRAKAAVGGDRRAGGVKAEAARRLGLDANQIKYLCRKYGL